MVNKNFFVTQIAIAFGTTLLFLITGASIFLSKATATWTRTDFVEKADLFANGVAITASHYICHNEIEDLKKALFELAQKKEIIYIAINQEKERVLEITNSNLQNAEPPSYTTYATIPSCDIAKAEHELEIGLNYKSLFQPIRTVQGILWGVLSLVFVTIILMVWVASKRIQEKISLINTKCDKLSSGDFSMMEGVDNQDEFNEILKQLNTVGIALNSKIKETEERQARLATQSKLSSLGEMAGGVAHEINNPMAIISGRLNQIKTALSMEPPKIPEALVFVQKSQDTVKRITDIVAGLRLFSRNADNDPFVRTTLKKVIEDSLSLTTERFKKLGVQISVEADASIEVFARPTQIAQVLINLLNNSSDAIENFESKWIRINLFKETDFAVLEVTDSGLGIPENILKKLMEPFFTTKPVGKGTGLGLSISKGIIESHKGKFEYKKGVQNTTFVISIPLAESQIKAA